MKNLIITFLAAWLMSGAAWSATTITYQGQLLHNGEPFTGSVDLTFAERPMALESLSSEGCQLAGRRQ